ncbi:hypothetical protein [Streptomyces sp. 135]|uniref:hypothetical protein n=1 Tax=Streptomyces sp. 135 TaxID=2838850 RepID=UPI001CBCC0A2|nr:hypothetical protein [Streptomyces sp. 135]
MLSRAAAPAALALAAVVCFLTAPAASADGGSGKAGCDNSAVIVTVCARDLAAAPAGPGSAARPAHRGGKSGGGAASKCVYEKAVPQPPAHNLAVKDGKRK